MAVQQLNMTLLWRAVSGCGEKKPTAVLPSLVGRMIGGWLTSFPKTASKRVGRHKETPGIFQKNGQNWVMARVMALLR